MPQFILEQSALTSQPVRVICTQPRRIAATAVADRVAAERGEPIGGTVGYQIRLESRMSSKTLLTFCTTGILLRTLMYEEKNLERVTHLIIDEVHERDRFCDFLLGVIRSRLANYPHIRLILMSAALDISVFCNYFEACPVVQVEGKCFPVEQYFLEDILRVTNHLGDVSHLTKAGPQLKQAESVGKLKKQLQLPVAKGALQAAAADEFDAETRLALDTLIEKSFVYADPSAFGGMFDAIRSSFMPVDYQHSQTKLSPLMVAAGQSTQTISSNQWPALIAASVSCASIHSIFLQVEVGPIWFQTSLVWVPIRR